MLATDFNRRVRLERRVTAGDGFSWSLYRRAWAKKLTGPGGEIFAGSQVLAQTDARYVIPFTDGVDPTMRIVDGPEIWNIVQVAPDDETGRDYLWLRVAAGANAG